MLYRGGVPSSQPRAAHPPKSAPQAKKNFGPKSLFSAKNLRSNSTNQPWALRDAHRASSALVGSSRLLVGSAADLCCSCWPSCCCHLASSLAAVHSARTTARQLPESWHDAIVVLLVVRLAVVHDVSGASAQSSAAERRLMVWPPSTKKGQKRRIHCLFEGISRNMLDPKDGESREKHCNIVHNCA